MNTVKVLHTTLRVAGEYTNGNFHLEGPKGGNVHFAKPLGNGAYAVYAGTNRTPIFQDNGLLLTLTREELAA